MKVLTPRQITIVKLVAKGNSNKAIADRLRLALPTVKWHVWKLFQLLGVKSRAELTTKFFQQEHK